MANTPNINAVAKSLDVSPAAEQALLQYAKKCVQPGLDYFQHQLENSLRVPLKAFKAARLFCPTMVASLNPSASDVESLLVFPFLSSTNDLKEELPIYLAELMDLTLLLTLLSGGSRTQAHFLPGPLQLKRHSSLSHLLLLLKEHSLSSILHLMIIKTTHSKTISRLRSCYSTIKEMINIIHFVCIVFFKKIFKLWKHNGKFVSIISKCYENCPNA